MDDAVVTDEVEDTLNYATIYQLTKQEMEKPSKLVENVAYRIAKSLVDHFPTIKEVHIKVAKCNQPMGSDKAVSGVELHIINEKTELNSRFYDIFSLTLSPDIMVLCVERKYSS